MNSVLQSMKFIFIILISKVLLTNFTCVSKYMLQNFYHYNNIPEIEITVLDTWILSPPSKPATKTTKTKTPLKQKLVLYYKL